MPSFAITEVPLLPNRDPKKRGRYRPWLKWVSGMVLVIATASLVAFLTSGKKNGHTDQNVLSGNFTVAFDRTDYADLEKPVQRQERRYGTLLMGKTRDENFSNNGSR
jgi:hypothetical protein